MTTTTDKLRGVLLAAMLVMSVFAGTVAFAGAATAQAGNVEMGKATSLDAGQSYWAGQTVFNDSALSSSATVQIMHANGELYDTITTDSEGDFKFSTDGMEGGFYLQEDDGTNLSVGGSNLSFTVRDQDLSASFEDGSVDNAHSSTTNFTLGSKRIGYNVTLTASGLSSEELQGVLNVTSNRTESGVAIVNVQQETFSTNFNGISAGNYTFEAEVNDTGATASADINVTEGGDAMSSFQSGSVVTDERGDIATYTINLENSNMANASIGSQDVNWKANFTVNDNNNDGEVTVQFNSYQSGSATVTDFVSATGEDSVDTSGGPLQGVHTNWDDQSPDSGLGSPIAAGQYEMTTGVTGDDDVTQLVLNEGSVDSAQVWTHPRQTSNLPEDVSALVSGVVEGDSVAMQDLAVVEFSASGLYGDASLDMQNLSTATNGSDVYSMNFTETNPGANAQPKTFQGNGTRAVYFDSANNTIYSVVDTSKNGIAAGDEYRATFTVHQNSNVTDEARSANATFAVEDRELSFTGVNESDVLPVGGNITGDTSIAAGSEFQVQVKSDSFVRTATATVQDDGTFVAPFDFSDVDTGTEVTVSAKSGDAATRLAA
ncbi:BGTF surface domain-containing protein [Halorussus caseinilyticus]|uniref:BGTF surface domain-containing protein n=1 Tax=Halorussus caseinilyticus TaxID=3034025 RepID=A0ABD5WKG4_9EURY